jgi:hypothetical protein
MSADTLLVLGFMFYMIKLVAAVAIPAVLLTWLYEKYIGG